MSSKRPKSKIAVLLPVLASTPLLPSTPLIDDCIVGLGRWVMQYPCGVGWPGVRTLNELATLNCVRYSEAKLCSFEVNLTWSLQQWSRVRGLGSSPSSSTTRPFWLKAPGAVLPPESHPNSGAELRGINLDGWSNRTLQDLQAVPQCGGCVSWLLSRAAASKLLCRTHGWMIQWTTTAVLAACGRLRAVVQ